MKADSERLVYSATAGIDVEWATVVLDAKGERIAFVGRDSEGVGVFLDGRRVTQADSARALRFDPRSSRFSFILTAQGRSRVHVDEQIGPWHDAVSPPVFDSSGRAFAYIAWENERSFIVRDGKRFGAEEDVSSPVFLPDGRLAYLARSGQDWAVCIEEDRRPLPFSRMRPLILPRPTGEALCLVGQRNGLWFVWVNGREEGGYDEVGSVTWSPNGKELAYSVRIGDQWKFIGRLRNTGEFDEIGPISWASSSEKLAFPARLKDEWYVVGSDGRHGPYEHVGSVRFGSIRSSLMFVNCFGGDPERGFQRESNFRCVLRFGDRVVNEQRIILNPQETRDEFSCAYLHVVPEDEGEEVEVVVGSFRERVDRVVSPVTVSGDGARVAYGIIRGRHVWWRTIEVR